MRELFLQVRYVGYGKGDDDIPQVAIRAARVSVLHEDGEQELYVGPVVAEDAADGVVRDLAQMLNVVVLSNAVHAQMEEQFLRRLVDRGHFGELAKYDWPQPLRVARVLGRVHEIDHAVHNLRLKVQDLVDIVLRLLVVRDCVSFWDDIDLDEPPWFPPCRPYDFVCIRLHTPETEGSQSGLSHLEITQQCRRQD